MKLLFVEDDAIIAEETKRALEAEGFAVEHTARGAEALSLAELAKPELIILDLGLPDVDGVSVLKSLRKKCNTPVLVLTARDGIEDKVAALDSGADDYVVKPFAMAELLARLRVIGRRFHDVTENQLRCGPVRLDIASMQLWVGEDEVGISRKEFMVLRSLLEHSGRIQTKERLENALYNFGDEASSNTIEVYISNLRKKLPENFIKTVRGVGYQVCTKN